MLMLQPFCFVVERSYWWRPV